MAIASAGTARRQRRSRLRRLLPLITNTDDTDLTAAQLLEAYKYQPRLEQWHAELKGPMGVAPVFLKDIE